MRAARPQYLRPFLLSAFLPAFLAGCASVATGLEQAVRVTPVCEGVIRRAACELANDKGTWKLEAPGTVSVRKSFGDLAVTCRGPGSEGKASFVSKPNTGVYGNVLAGGLIGFAVDSASGSGYNYPEELPVVLWAPCPEPAAP
ncbi:MAG TPA: hypothetical protein VGD76_06400 [Ramlibacter sp.]